MGMRITLAVIIPSVILYQLGLLETMINIPLGALFSGLADPPGPPIHRRNGLFANIILNTTMVLISGYSQPYPVLLGIEIAVFGFLFSMLSIYGTRAGSIGLMALIVFVLQIKPVQPGVSIPEEALFLFAGNAWYIIFSFVFYNIRPYLPIQQLLGECLNETAEYLRTRAAFYLPSKDLQALFSDLMEKQIRIHHLQEHLRELLFSTRKVVTESTRKGRNLTMIFIDSVDLLERIMTAQQDYEKLHLQFDDTIILERIHTNIRALANALNIAGLAVQQGKPAPKFNIEEEFQLTWEAFKNLRKEKLNAEKLEAFISLRHILYSIEDITQRINRIRQYSNINKENSAQIDPGLDLQQFKSNPMIRSSLFFSNMSLGSQNFRHSIRLSLALVVGFVVSLIASLPHAYWILLTIATIMKPAYSLSKQRNIQRLTGTFAGAAVAFSLLLLNPSNTALFVAMLFFMVLSYSFLQLNYGLSSAFLTIFILFGFRFMDPLSFQDLLLDRVLDTAIGSVIAYLVSMLVLPLWESDKMEEYIRKAMDSNKIYFDTISAAFTGKPLTVMDYKMARKEAFIALANISDNLQKMLSDPKNQRADHSLFHQFVSATHILTSQIAALAVFGQRFAHKYAGQDFVSLGQTIDRQFAGADNPAPESFKQNSNQIFRNIDRLMQIRKNELSGNQEGTSEEMRKTLSELKIITDQYRLIFSTVTDIRHILKKLHGQPNAELTTVSN